MPRLKILKPVHGEMAERLQKCFPPGVLELEEDTNGLYLNQPFHIRKLSQYLSCSRLNNY